MQFPTLAEQLDVQGHDPRPSRELGRLLFLVEGGSDDARVRELVAQIHKAAPRSSLVGVVSEREVQTAPAGDADLTNAADWQTSPLDGLHDLRALLDAVPGADLVLVEPRHQLTADMLGRLVSASELDTVCASVSDGGVTSDDQWTREAARRGIPPPSIAAPNWGLVLVRREAIEVALDNVRAAARSEAPRNESVRELVARLLSAPGLVHRSIPDGALRSTGETKRRNGGGPLHTSTLHVTIDARCLEEFLSGTQVQLINLMKALGAKDEVRITALSPPRVHKSALPLLEPLRDSVRFASETPRRADVFHRPNQIPSRLVLVECMGYGRRLVLTHQDMILDRTPAFFYSVDVWREFSQTTRAALSAADHVAFFSRHAALDAASDGFVDPERVTVVPLGVDHLETGGEAHLPARVAELRGRPFLVMVGTPLAHKNRLFALRVLRELLSRSWDGALVLAGADFPWGSSRHDERAMLDRDPRMRDRVVDLGHVSESEKRALYRDAALVLFPSLYEGFGLVPFEAAAFGTASLYAWRGPLPEFLPRLGALPTDFSVASTASRILEIVGSPRLASELVSEIQSAASSLTWAETARGYLEVYERAVAAEPRVLDREILEGIRLTPKEQQLIQTYRFRPGFATAVDKVMRAGTAVMRSRVGRAWDTRGKRGGG